MGRNSLEFNQSNFLELRLLCSACCDAALLTVQGTKQRRSMSQELLFWASHQFKKKKKLLNYHLILTNSTERCSGKKKLTKFNAYKNVGGMSLLNSLFFFQFI